MKFKNHNQPTTAKLSWLLWFATIWPWGPNSGKERMNNKQQISEGERGETVFQPGRSWKIASVARKRQAARCVFGEWDLIKLASRVCSHHVNAAAYRLALPRHNCNPCCEASLREQITGKEASCGFEVCLSTHTTTRFAACKGFRVQLWSDRDCKGCGNGLGGRRKETQLGKQLEKRGRSPQWFNSQRKKLGKDPPNG